MDLYYSIVFFIFGSIFGSFFNVVGYRLPKEESIVYPPSHCPNCNHQLTAIELIPILSYIFLGAKCKNCHIRISPFYPIFEFITGFLFMMAYQIFGLSFETLLAIVFLSTLVIVFISDYQTMIIPDQVIIASSIMMVILIFFIRGIGGLGLSILDGVIAFGSMWLLKLLGDFMFKKESMGGGDIKLLFIFGLYFGWPMALLSVVIASFIGLPISIIVLLVKKDNVVPFGPFLSMAAALITLLQINFETIKQLFIR
jgi:leader peptidase (prepilin peptidase)/N-methyltransferase